MEKFIGTKVVNAKPMTRQEYNDIRGWDLPADEDGADEDGADEGYLVEYVDGGQANHPRFSGYISWSPKAVFENAYQAQPAIVGYSADDVVIEGMIQARGLNARRVSLDELHGSIKSVEIIRHRIESGSVLRFAILTMDNGFTVTGRPSVSISPENDNDEVGVKIAIQNAVFELWPYVGFRVVESKFKSESEA